MSVPEQWSYHNPVQVFFGAGCRAKLLNKVKHKNVLVVCSKRGRQQFESDAILREIDAAKTFWVDRVQANPSLHDLQDEIDSITSNNIDFVLGFGGGSALDAAKVLSLGLSRELSEKELRPLLVSPSTHAHINTIPTILVPTTSGTGSEVTPFSTVWDHEQKKKHSLAGPNLYAEEAYVDPELAYELPPEPTLSTGLDAINQAAESLWNKNSTPVSESYASRALTIGIPALRTLKSDPQDKTARKNMSECSLLAGIAISQTRTALCHSMSYPLTAHFGIPHGLACAFTMLEVLKLNLTQEDGRFARLKNNLGSEDLVAYFEEFTKELDVFERAMDYISSPSDALVLTDEMFSPGRADNNLAEVDQDTIRHVLEQSLKTRA